MTGFAKLWSSIVHSTVWRESAETKVVWITLLAISDSGGYVGASLPGLADLARVDLSACEAALARLKAPDPHSRTKEHEGRRIEDRDGGWFILNYRKHREGIDVEIRRAQNREAAKRHREKLAALRKASAEPSAPSAESAPISNGKPLSAQAVKQEAVTQEAEGVKNNTHTQAICDFCERLPSDARPSVVALGRAQRDPTSWATALGGMLNGLGTARGELVTPAELGQALVEIAAGGVTPTMANVRSFLARIKRDATKDAATTSDGRAVDPSDGIGQFLARHST